jgi:hypothetical protein
VAHESSLFDAERTFKSTHRLRHFWQAQAVRARMMRA